MASLADLAELVRAPAALSVPGDVLAGAAAAGVLDRRTPALAGASVLLYWAGMAANDWADRRLDAVERPERPIPSGRVSPPAALGLAAGLTAAGLALATAAGGRRAAAVAVPLATAIWGYDLLAKNTAAGPAVMAACRGLDVLLGTTSAGPAPAGRRAGGSAGTRLARALPAALTVAAHTWTVTELSRREVTGTDRRLPRATLAGTAVVAATALGRADPVPVALAAGYATRYGAAQARVVADPSPGRVRAAVAAGITGLPALQGALTARAGARLLGLAVAAAAPLGRRLARLVSPT
ncbi:UbiA family prenyltransferase [Micromonospora sp. 4G57]|uniref:UbiA family prenyltransferase n=1 Tax=Micromonospora sicca TaxID=2202420 RepID=A0ABU5JAH1_9ACTN|nr:MULTISPECIES: UbiA family prenyltransferase [unclassified Micromonospora]MDZ5443894.1 UbiA family prenyltransferase [Micromonospora sp. 4G57]MDZ5489588.1 UbiA family prenyltransferase [Micromonospora sp. 4G53]